MRISKYLTMAASAVALALAFGANAYSQEKTVKIGTEGAYPPFNSLTSDGELVGFDIDIANALCEEMQVKCEFVINDWDGMIPSLIAGKFDAVIASMSITEERKEKVDFSNKYYNSPPAIAVPKDSDIEEASDAALSGRILGAQAATTHSNFAEEKIPSAEVRLYPTADEYKLDIASGRIDAVIDDVIVLGEWLETDDGSCCKLLGTMATDPVIHGPGAGVAIRKGDDDLREMFNEAIVAIRENGKYKEINDKYFEFDVYGE
ncbi:MAG: ABC transporter substrate-binding protein [Pseudomonadota bacterium]